MTSRVYFKTETYQSSLDTINHIFLTEAKKVNSFLTIIIAVPGNVKRRGPVKILQYARRSVSRKEIRAGILRQFPQLYNVQNHNW